MRFLKRINDRGTVTLPAEVREALDVEAGDIVEFEVIGVVRRKAPSMEATAQHARTAAIGGDAQ